MKQIITLVLFTTMSFSTLLAQEFTLGVQVSPTFSWIRLAQRIPVRIHLNKIPEDVSLRVGTTASVLVKTDTAEAGK